MYSWEGLLDLENEEYVVSVFYLGSAQLFSHFCQSIYPQGTTPVAQARDHTAPASKPNQLLFIFQNVIFQKMQKVLIYLQL